MTDRLALVSASDAKFFELLKGMLCSVRDKEQGARAHICIFDLGLSEAQRQWLLIQGATIASPGWASSREASTIVRGLAARCNIPQYFPQFDIYLWIDADAWVHDWRGASAYIDNARQWGFCVAAEADAAYAMPRILATHQGIMQQCGVSYTDELLMKPIINAGVFAGRRDAVHWAAWSSRVTELMASAPPGFHDFFIDQLALNAVISIDNLATAVLPARYNWACHWALPAVSSDGRDLLHPLPPHDPLMLVHQTAETKQGFHRLKTPAGFFISRRLAYQSASQLPPGDYVSPGLAVTLPDACFPNMIAGDNRTNSWPYLRRDIPHRWLTDARAPTIGFANRDEAAILYNTALRFQGQKALEIGCFMGWSAVHLALAGVQLDIVDPLLADDTVRSSIIESLQAANVPGPVVLHSGASPAAIEQIATSLHRRWSLFFIDGNHDGSGPLDDAIACERFAEPDALVLFHDLAAPAVAQGLRYFKEKGWQIRLYHTAQIMAAAWRGQVAPIDHRPDPTVDWPMPQHVRALHAA